MVLVRAGEWAENPVRLNPVAVRLELQLLLQGQGNIIDQRLALVMILGALAASSEEARVLLAKFLDKKK